MAEALARDGFEVFGTVFGDGYRARGVPEDHFFTLNLTDRDKTQALVKDIQPQWLFHLAALSSPAQSFNDPLGTMTNNIEAQVNLLDGALAVEALEKILIVGSAEEYGLINIKDLPLTEATDLRPLSPYAVSKIAQDFMGLQYYLSFGLPVIRVRPFNHTGPRQAPAFVVPAFAKQIAEIEAGKQAPKLKVGNLEATRDFTDVADMMRAYRLAMEKGEIGEVYNLGSGKEYKIGGILEQLLALARVKIEVVTDPDKMKPADVPRLAADCGKFRQLTGWKAKIPFETTLKEVLDYWRHEVQSI